MWQQCKELSCSCKHIIMGKMGMLIRFAALLFLVLMEGRCCEGCWKQERDRLLYFKALFINVSSVPDAVPDGLRNWEEGTDCCEWERVECDNTTGRVATLTFGGLLWSDEVSWTLNLTDFLVFEDLTKLDLSYNHIEGLVANEGFENQASRRRFSNLEALDLSQNRLNGTSINLPSSLSVFSSLKSLYLANNHLTVNSFHGLSKLHSLEVLELAENNLNTSFENSIDNGRLSWPTSLQVLGLRGNNFRNDILSSFNGLQQLKSLDLAYNNLQGLLNITGLNALSRLKILDMGGNNIENFVVHQGWSNLNKLKEFYLSYNKFEGPLPSTFGNMTSLWRLDISNSQFTGNLAPCLASLTSLEYLDFEWNQLQITTSFSLFANHSRLKSIYGDGNNVILDPHPTSQSWVPKFQLQKLRLSSMTQAISIPLPNFLRYQNKLTLLDFSNSKFKGEFPNWLLENNTKLTHLILGNNSFTGHFRLPSRLIPNIESIDVSENTITGQILSKNTSVVFPRLSILDMSKNAISGSLPRIFGQMKFLSELYLSDNNLSGEIPENISTGSPLLALPHLSYLRLDGNNLSGTLPNSFLNSSELFHLDISNNHFVGKLPRLQGNSTNLMELFVSNNHLEGSIPEDFGHLVSMDLSGNNLSGSIPSFVNSSLSIIILRNNRLSGLTPGIFDGIDLQILDLSNNDIIGTIQDITSNIDGLHILLLKGNQFRGQIPKTLCSLMGISILDFSHNSLSGPIPNCLGELSFNLTVDEERQVSLPRISMVDSQANFTTKGRSYKYEGSILKYMSGMDLSYNKLDGDIPPELGKLTMIKAMNLSHNSFTGQIPSTFSNLKQIESLDLSFNKLSSRIPPQLTQLTFLEVFSVAHNNLSGEIPERKGQFITFDDSSYEGNPFLCGPPLQRSCTKPSPKSSDVPEGDIDGGFMDLEVFYISMTVSYTAVLLVIAAVLYINPYWRRAWFYYIELVITTCYYFVIDRLLKLY